MTHKGQLIRQLNRANLGTLDYSKVRDLVSELISGVPLPLEDREIKDPIFRGVKHTTKPTNVEALGYPPKDLVTGFGRCNAPSTQVFYGCSDPLTVFAELRVVPGDIVYRSKWTASRKLTIFHTSLDLEPPHFSLTTESRRIMDFFDTRFSFPIHETFSTQFKITAALMDLLHGEVSNRESTLGTFVYPSVVDPHKQLNIAIHADVADQCLSVNYVEEIEVLDPADYPPPEDDTPFGYLVLKKRDFADSFPNDQIRWQGRPATYKSNEHPIKIEKHRGSERFAWDKHGNFIDPS